MPTEPAQSRSHSHPVQTSYERGTCHYSNPQLGVGLERRNAPDHVTTRSQRSPPHARNASSKPRPPPGRPGAHLLPTKLAQIHVLCTPNHKMHKGCKPGNDSKLGDSSRRANPELPTPFPADTCSSPNGGFRAWSGMGVPQVPSQARGSPTPEPRRLFHSRGQDHWGPRTY